MIMNKFVYNISCFNF